VLHNPNPHAEAIQAGADAVIAEAARICGPGFNWDKLRSFDQGYFEAIARDAYRAAFDHQ